MYSHIRRRCIYGTEIAAPMVEGPSGWDPVAAELTMVLVQVGDSYEVFVQNVEGQAVEGSGSGW